MKKTPGTVYKNRNRYWWAVRLPGEPKRKARPLVPPGDTLATDNLEIAKSLAYQMWSKAVKAHEPCKTEKSLLLSHNQACQILKSLATEFRMYAAHGDLSYYEISLARDALRAGNGFYDDSAAIELVEKALTGRRQHVIDRLEWSDPDDPLGQFKYELFIAPVRAPIDAEVLGNLMVNVARTAASIPDLAALLRCERLESPHYDAIAVQPWWSEVLTNLAESKQHPVIRMKKQGFSLKVDLLNKYATFQVSEIPTSMPVNSLIQNEKSAERISQMARSKHSWIKSLEAGFLRTSAHAIEWLLDPSIKDVPRTHAHVIPQEVF